MKILVVNCGSSSIKYQLFNMEDESVLAKGQIERIGVDGRVKHTGKSGKQTVIDIDAPNHTIAFEQVIKLLLDEEYGSISSLDEINVVSHRIVQGANYFDKSVIVTPENLQKIKDCIPLAPLHNPAHVMGIEAAQKAMPDAFQTATFDTAFHLTMPEKASVYALPKEIRDKYKIKRYGAHGTSHRYVSKRASEVLGKPLDELKLITCHLGAGSSLCAIDKGKSVDTSMGFTPLAGVMMGTRCGDMDPAITVFLANNGYTPDELNDIYNKKSGLLALSEVSSDFRDVEDENIKGNKVAGLALDTFAYHVQKFIGAYIATLNGIDAIVFTAGIGEMNFLVRARILSNLTGIGIDFDEEKNEKALAVEADITGNNGKIKVLIIPTNEELMIARDAKELSSIHDALMTD